jgi:hypothetical protein
MSADQGQGQSKGRVLPPEVLNRSAARVVRAHKAAKREIKAVVLNPDDKQSIDAMLGRTKQSVLGVPIMLDEHMERGRLGILSPEGTPPGTPPEATPGTPATDNPKQTEGR